MTIQMKVIITEESFHELCMCAQFYVSQYLSCLIFGTHAESGHEFKFVSSKVELV